jgi:hypothetical protein
LGRGGAAAIAVLAAAAAASSAACSYPTATQPYPGACGPFFVTTWVPESNAVGVPTDVTIRLALNDYPDPATLGGPTLGLTTGVFFYVGTYGVDLLDRAVYFRPDINLLPDLGYTVTLQAGLRSLHGCPTELAYRNFRTGDGPANPPPPPPPPAFTDVLAIFAQHCSGGACHRQAPADGGGCLTAPAAGLSLCDSDARAALVAVPSREVSSLELVHPRDSARSYLMRKLVPAPPDGGPMPTVIGQREPPGPPLGDADLRTIAAWIDFGAE